jgi:hypothetical protein
LTFWLYILLFSMPSIIEDARDPMGGWLPSAVTLRDLECEPTTTEGARRDRPGEVADTNPRGDFLIKRAVICRQRLMPHGVRRPQDDAILLQLRGTARELTALVAELDAPLRGRTWMVEAFYPQPAVGAKVGFAIKNALLDRNLRVTDRAPTLAAGDIEVIGRTSLRKAYPLACARYSAAGSMGPNDALLSVMLLDPRETDLHAGVCADGVWRWLR